MARLPAFDLVAERAAASAQSLLESELLGAIWAHGEDAWLREDYRFRPTPWGRWVATSAYLANELLVRSLRAEGVSELSLAEQLEVLQRVAGRPAVVCPADPRLRFDGDRVRLAPSELTREPLLEQVPELLQYVTHLPVLSLKAAAASEPAGEWGPTAEPQHVEPMGWLRVERLGRPLHRRMFVAQIRGHSMDGGHRPIEDGDWAVFEFTFHEGVGYDAGSSHPVVLVRGAFNDPETGSYAVKKWDRDAPDIRLVSANPDKQRFPDIVVPLDAADHLRIVASFAKVLGPSDFARRPKPQRRPGRRLVEGRAGLDEQRERLGRRIDAFFEGRPTTEVDEFAAETETGWCARVVCEGLAAGGPHVEVGPLSGLPPFVKKLRIFGADGRDGVVLAANARERTARVPVGPGSGPWRWEAVGFEDEEELGLERLAVNDLARDTVSVFRVDAGGTGRRQSGAMLASGQTYHLLIPPGVGDPALGLPLTDGWRLWTVDLANAPSPTTHAALQTLGLGLGEAWPRLEWALLPPATWRATPRGERFPVFEVGSAVVVQAHGLDAEDQDPPVLFLHGPAGTERLELPRTSSALVSLGELAAGRWACALVPPRTEVRPTTLLFEVAEQADAHVDASWSVELRPTSDGKDGFVPFSVRAPPGWPVIVSWRALGTVPLATVHADGEGNTDLTGVLPLLDARARRARVGDVVVDLGELGQRVLPHDRRPDVEQVRVELAALWAQRQGMVRSRGGAWMTLVAHWFTPVCELLGYALEGLPQEGAQPTPEEALPCWRLVVDERDGGVIRRSPSRALVLTTDLDGTRTAGLEAVDVACAHAQVREAIVTDGIRWAKHRKGNRQLRSTIWDLDAVLRDGTVEAMLADLAEGL